MSIPGLETSCLVNIFDTFESGLILIDGDYRILHWNSWVSKESGVALEDAKGACFDDVFPNSAESSLRQDIVHAIESREIISIGITTKLQCFSFDDQADSSTILNRSVKVHPHELRENVWGAVIQITDNMEFDLLEARATLAAQFEERTREISTARERAERSDLAKSHVLANLSHEFRTPLNAIIGFSDLMQTKAFGPLGHDFYSDYAENIHASSIHLLHLIEQVLDVSRIESGAQSVEEININVEQALRNCGTMLAMQADQTNVSMTIEIPEKIPMVIADPTKFQQIFINLIGNAIKYNKADGDVRIYAKTTPEKELIIYIEDTGDGISEADLPGILQKFGRGSSSYLGGQEGLGLGLTIVQSLAEESSATFLLTSEIGVGTTATVTFPDEKLIWPPDAT